MEEEDAWASTYQVAIAIVTDEDGLVSRRATTNVGGAVAGGLPTDAKDQTVGFDGGLVGV